MSQDLLNNRQKWEAKIIAKAWADPGFKARLMADPQATLTEFAEQEGIQLSEGLTLPQITVLEETREQSYLVIPLNFDDVELTAAELDFVSGGSAGCGCSGCKPG
ncbi:MAG: NHLP leader peptide family RiPP precursor [Anaerolineales bacterium]